MCDEAECQEGTECCCSKSLPFKGLLHLTILTLLKDRDMHGSDMHRNLKTSFGIDTIKPIVYTMLRRMEKDNLVVSSWDIKSSGPAKRVYKITEEGLEYLTESAEGLRRMTKILDSLLKKNSGEQGSQRTCSD